MDNNEIQIAQTRCAEDLICKKMELLGFAPKIPPKKFNGNLNAALILLDSVLGEIEEGFIACNRCGDQEETKNLDFVGDIKAAKEEILKAL